MEDGKKFCIHCGQVIDNDCVICPKCGKQVEKIQVSQTVANQQRQQGNPPPITVHTKTCKYCKATIYKSAKVCPECHKKQPNIKIYVALGVLAVLVICYIFGEKKDPEDTDKKSNRNESQESQIIEESKNTEKNQEEREEPSEEKKESEITLEEIKEQAQELNYKDVMRNPDDYMGQYFCVTVKISTSETGSFFSGYDRAYKAHTNDEYDLWFGDMIYLLDNRNTESEEYIKILENDIITVYGRFDGLVETKNVLSGAKGEEMSLQILYIELMSE